MSRIMDIITAGLVGVFGASLMFSALRGDAGWPESLRPWALCCGTALVIAGLAVWTWGPEYDDD